MHVSLLPNLAPSRPTSPSGTPSVTFQHIQPAPVFAGAPAKKSAGFMESARTACLSVLEPITGFLARQQAKNSFFKALLEPIVYPLGCLTHLFGPPETVALMTVIARISYPELPLWQKIKLTPVLWAGQLNQLLFGHKTDKAKPEAPEEIF